MFTLIKKAIRLSSSDRWLACVAVGVLAFVRLALVILPFQTLRNILSATSVRRAHTYPHDEDRAAQVAWAIDRAQRCVPGATCLPQALTAEWLLRRRGHDTELKIGVATDREGRLRAHAWVESRGRTIVGRLPDLSSFTVLTTHSSPLP